MITTDACSIILLAKATVLEIAAETYKMATTSKVLEEVLKGKKNMSIDALIVEKLKKENKIQIVNHEVNIAQKLAKDFNMGQGEASIIAVGIKEKGIIIATDNRQGRKVAVINNLLLVGSPDIVVSLYKKKKITREKTLSALKALKKEGWFDDFIIDKAMEDVK